MKHYLRDYFPGFRFSSNKKTTTVELYRNYTNQWRDMNTWFEYNHRINNCYNKSILYTMKKSHKNCSKTVYILSKIWSCLETFRPSKTFLTVLKLFRQSGNLWLSENVQIRNKLSRPSGNIPETFFFFIPSIVHPDSLETFRIIGTIHIAFKLFRLSGIFPVVPENWECWKDASILKLLNYKEAFKLYVKAEWILCYCCIKWVLCRNIDFLQKKIRNTKNTRIPTIFLCSGHNCIWV